MAKNKNHNLFKRGGTWYFKKRVRDKRTRKDRWIKEALSTSLTEARRLRDPRLKELLVYGGVQKHDSEEASGPLFGKLAQQWAKITKARVKSSTYVGYQIAMNAYVLKRFGNTPIRMISWLDVEDFITDLTCTAKRINNLLVPMRGVFKMAHKAGFVDQNIMTMVENRKIEKPQIKPLSMEEVDRFLNCVNPFL
jgi:integrase